MEKITVDLKENQMVEFSNGVLVTPKTLQILYNLQWGYQFEWEKKVENGGVEELHDLLTKVTDLLVRCNSDNPPVETLFSGIESLHHVKKELDLFRIPRE